MLNKTSQTNTDMQWLKSASVVKPVPPIAPTATGAQRLQQQPQPDITRFIESAHVAGGLLYTDALRQKEERLASPAAGMPEPPHPRSLADLPYLISPEYAAYKKQSSATTPATSSKAAGGQKGTQQAKRSLSLDSATLWLAAIFVAVFVVVVMWLFKAW